MAVKIENGYRYYCACAECDVIDEGSIIIILRDYFTRYRIVSFFKKKLPIVKIIFFPMRADDFQSNNEIRFHSTNSTVIQAERNYIFIKTCPLNVMG